ncbi:sigma-70 family RNA polymerase sigma factor [Bacillus timonensis]|uniref:sigma-70 family RNA polymerase sigma factor n=1 Tax=Bacillus timonensis TaxID=1033734 RepID=UPI000289DF0B|nr:sigma-70 family RNA polymerase sigma factor [Bacillus timonensis]
MKNVVTHESTVQEEVDPISYIEELIEAYERQITNFVFTYVKDWTTAQEVTQDVFIKVYEKYATFEGRSNIKTWLYTIAANQAKDYLRAQERRKKGLKQLFANMIKKVESDTPESILLANENNQVLADKVLALPVIYREVVILFYYEEMTTPEISELLQVSASTIRTRLDRARKMLKDEHERSEKNEG